MPDRFDPDTLDAIPLPAFYVDPETRVAAANAHAVELQPQAAENRPLSLVFRQPALIEAIEACLSSRTAQRASYLHRDGRTEHRFDVSIAPAGGGALVCLRDISDEQQLDKMRRDFVANVSHELRTPLTAILGFIETLQGPAKNDSAAHERFLGTMANEASRMNRLVGDLLSLSKVEEVSRMRPTDLIDLDGLIRSAIQTLSPLAADTACDITFGRAAEELPIPADADQLLQVVTNLIENALKYGGQGTRITLTIDELDRASGLRGPAVKLTVADNGPGIDEIHLPRLTERFYRIDSHRSREKGGTGLGLAIVKHIVHRHRGRLQIQSTLGQGTEISVFLPKT